MRMKKRGLVVAILACTLVLAALSGCTPTPAPTPIPTSTTDAPVFESDEEALAAATEAYAAYLKMSDLILSEGGQGPERIRPLTSGELAEIEEEGFASVRDSGFHSLGESKFHNFTIQSVNEGVDDGRGIVTAYLCSDVSAVEVVDADGASVVAPDRPALTPFQVSFDLGSQNPLPLVVSSSDVWDGAGVC